MEHPNHEPLLAEFSTEILLRQRHAYLAIDVQGLLREQGGELARYGLSNLKIDLPVPIEAGFLREVLPLTTSTYLNLPLIALGACRQAAVHLFKRNELTWVVIVDPSAGGNDSSQSSGATDSRSGEGVLDKSLAREIAERASKGLDSINQKGERRDASVLFADLRGFTTFCDTNSTVDIFPLLNQFLGAMIKPVIDNKGIVDKIIGDAVMAVFGLGSDEGPDHKWRAIETGKEMIARIADLTADPNDPASVLGVGVGIASGDVVVGTLGNERRRSFTVIGHRVNLAARLESQARPGELLVDVATWDGISHGQEHFELTDLWLKGLTRPVPAMSCFPLTNGKPLASPVA